MVSGPCCYGVAVRGNEHLIDHMKGSANYVCLDAPLGIKACIRPANFNGHVCRQQSKALPLPGLDMFLDPTLVAVSSQRFVGAVRSLPEQTDRLCLC